MDDNPVLGISSPRRFLGVLCLLACFLALNAVGARAKAPGNQENTAYLNLIIDDAKNFELWRQLALDAETFGYTVTFAAETNRIPSERWHELRKMVAQGHELASHTANHLPLSLEAVVGIRFHSSSAGKAVITIDSNEKTLTGYIDDSPKPAFSLDTSLEGECNTLKKLVNKLNSYPGFHAKLQNTRYGNGRSAFLLDVSTQNIFNEHSFFPLYVDEEQQITYELRLSKQEIERKIPGYTVDAIVYPYLIVDDLVKKVAKDTGYTVGRYGPRGNRFVTKDFEYDIYAVWANYPHRLFPMKPESRGFKQAVHGFLSEMKQNNGMGCLYSHGPEQFSNAQWRALLEIIAQDPNVKVVSLSEMPALREQLISRARQQSLNAQ